MFKGKMMGMMIALVVCATICNQTTKNVLVEVCSRKKKTMYFLNVKRK